MNIHATFAALSRPALAAILCLLPLASMGCGSAGPPSLTITSINQNQVWTQEFSQAWVGHNKNGDVDVVLVDECTQKAMSGAQSTAPVRQVMHIRVLWCPTRDTRAVVSNACVKWYVIGRSGPQDMLEYTGSAFVYLNEEDGSTTLKIRNAVLNPTTRLGQLTDPVGPSRLEGTFEAQPNSQIVNRILSDLKTAQAAAASTPLPRVARTQ
jgi:hypothetical protein